MSELPHFSKLTNFMSGMSDILFLQRHYEGVGENQGKFFAGHYEGAKKSQGIFRHYEGHQKNQEVLI
jgi:hypothetical protein